MKHIAKLFVLLGVTGSLVACGDDAKTIVVGASPSPHSEILNSEAVKSYIESKGYKLKVKEYQDYVLPNRALNDGSIDANYFQHIPYIEKQIADYGYEISAVCTVHNEPLNLYGKVKTTDFTNKKVYIIDDASNVERAYKLLVDNNIIKTYSVENFDKQHPVYTSDINVTIECVDSGLLARHVSDGGYAVIPGNYALNAWDTTTATNYRILGESTEVAYPNIIATRNENVKSDKTNILVEALSQPAVKAFIESTFGPTVNYSFSDLRA